MSLVGKTFDELLLAILPILPDAIVGEDNQGQLVIYTNLYETDEMVLAAYNDDDAQA